jgi:hypothetical protein
VQFIGRCGKFSPGEQGAILSKLDPRDQFIAGRHNVCLDKHVAGKRAYRFLWVENIYKRQVLIYWDWIILFASSK